MMTINSLCLFSVTEFMDRLVEFKRKHGRNKPLWSVNILRFPSFQNCLTLPEDIRTERKQHIERWLDKTKREELIHDFERVSVERLVDYLDVVKTPHQDSSPLEILQRDFKNFFLQYDIRRGKNIKTAFADHPRFIEWFESVKVD